MARPTVIGDCLDCADAGRKLGGVCARTLKRMVQRGEIEGFKRGREWIFSERSIEAYLRLRQVGPLEVVK